MSWNISLIESKEELFENYKYDKPRIIGLLIKNVKEWLFTETKKKNLILCLSIFFLTFLDIISYNFCIITAS